MSIFFEISSGSYQLFNFLPDEKRLEWVIKTLTTFSSSTSLNSSSLTSSECCAETTTVCTLSGSRKPLFCLYSTVTCVFVSGSNHGIDPFRWHSPISWFNLWDKTTVRGISSSVSSVAYPNINPWSPAPISSTFLPTWTPWAISGLCCSTATKTLQVL